MHQLLPTLTLSLLLLSGSGCSTFFNGGGPGSGGPTATNLAPAIKVAVLVGSTYALREHPEWRPHFEAAAQELAIIETAPQIDFTTVLAIITRLPVRELQSDDARLAIIGATILLSTYGEQAISLDQLQELRPIVTALRSGIELALDHPVAQVRARRGPIPIAPRAVRQRLANPQSQPLNVVPGP